ncbi:MAG: M23 family metallopeptidase [Chloroflexi bacterium]|nr:M23 family metallopeptidase [Chloroflexota bacterium]
MTIPVQYPSAARPARITRKFTAPGGLSLPHEGVDIYAPRNTNVRAGAAGEVMRVVLSNDQLNYGPYVNILTKVGAEKIRVFYANLKDITVKAGDVVTLGQVIAKSAGDSIKLVIQSPPANPYPGFPLKYIAHPKNHLMVPRLRLKPIDNRLRLRRTPSTTGEVVGFVNQWDLLETPENDYKVLRDVGKQDKWLKVVNPFDESEVVYAAAWYLKAISLDDPKEGIPGIPIGGINLDRFHPLGTPAAAPLANLGWVRLLYNLSYNPDNNSYGNTDLNATYARYLPIFQRYANNGNKLIVIFNHQTYGEAKGYVWDQMSSGQWDDLITSFVFYVRQIAQQWASSGLVYAYQIWNEQDSPPTNQSAVPVPAGVYAKMFTQTIRAIRAVDSKAKVITGGHVTGNALGVNYARAALGQIPLDATPDGIGVHPYMTGPMDSPFSIFGTINAAIQAWSGVLPNKPLWLTEWGILDKQGNDSIVNDATAFADGFLDICLNDYRGMVACAVWYAWADTMHNGYGLVRSDSSARQPLYNHYLGFA